MTAPHIEFTRRLVTNFSSAKAIKALVFLCVSIAVAKAPTPHIDLWGIGQLLDWLGALTPDQRTCLGIFAGAALFWVTELIPPFATGVVVLVVCVFLLGHPGEEGSSVAKYLNPLSSQTLLLFFGGLVLAHAAMKHGFDVRLARAFITPFGARPASVLLGIIFTTALFSAFMSNTATTAMMLAIVSPVLAQVGDRPKMRKALVLAVPFAANIGGMATIIGTPPNAVAASQLEKLGHKIDFLEWMLFASPLVIVLLLVLWLILIVLLKPERENLRLKFPDTLEVTPDLAVVVITFTVTVLLWLTSTWNHLPSGVVALVPVGVFSAFGILTSDDLKKVDWDVLALIAGGMVLGEGMTHTGLSKGIVEAIPFDQISTVWLIVGMAAVSLVISNFMSHTAASNLLIPIVIAIGAMTPKTSAVTIALASSLAMSLPISTPPNALAYSTRQVTTRDMLRYGTLLSVVGAVLVTVLMTYLRTLWLPAS